MKITCITGTRADYPRVKSVLYEIKKHKVFELSLIVTGSHLLEEYGYSAQEIIDDGFVIDKKVPMFMGDYNSLVGMAKAAARCTKGIAEALEEIKPDLVLLTVDRVETMAAAVAVSLMNFPIAHIQGGEVTGTIDESIRHAMSKFAHIHFPATDDARKRLIRLGENPDDIYVVGCPSIDVLINTPIINRETLENKYGLNFSKPFIILIQHPVTTESDSSFDQIKNTIDAITKLKIQTIALLPNNDFGYSKIIEQIKSSGIKWYPSLPTLDFINLYRNAWAIVGNSSSGIHESPTFGIPAVNIGNRQMGRQRAFNVIDTPNNTIEIQKAIQKALFDMKFRNKVKNIINPYGQGSSAKEIVKILKEVSLEEKIQKVFYENE